MRISYRISILGALGFWGPKAVAYLCLMGKSAPANDPESAARARGTICSTVKRIKIIQSAKREQNQRLNSLLDPVALYEWR